MGVRGSLVGRIGSGGGGEMEVRGGLWRENMGFGGVMGGCRVWGGGLWGQDSRWGCVGGDYGGPWGFGGLWGGHSPW